MPQRATDQTRSTRSATQLAREYLAAIDSLLDRVSVLLDKTQPPIAGKITLVWRKNPGQRESDRPTFIRWEKYGSQWRSRELPLSGLSMRAARSKQFYENHKSVANLLRIGQAVLQRRRELLQEIRKYEMSVRERANGNKGFMEQKARDIYTLEEAFGDAVFPWTRKGGEGGLKYFDDGFEDDFD